MASLRYLWYSHILGILDEKRLFLSFFRDVKLVAYHSQDRIPHDSPQGSAESGVRLNLLNLFHINETIQKQQDAQPEVPQEYCCEQMFVSKFF